MTIDPVYNTELAKIELAKKYFSELPKITSIDVNTE